MNSNEETVVVSVPNVIPSKLYVTNSQIEYRGNAIRYKDASEIAFNSRKTTYWYVFPLWKSYYCMVTDGKTEIRISMNSPFCLLNVWMNRSYRTVTNVINQFIAPHVIDKMISHVLKQKALVIANMQISYEGCVIIKRKKASKILSWSNYGGYSFSNGSITIYEITPGGKKKAFKTISLGIGNAIVLPEVFEFCYSKWGK